MQIPSLHLADKLSVQKMRQFKFDPSRRWQPNEEIIQPPNMTIYPLPFNWNWQQNPHITEQIDPNTGERILVNAARFERLHVEYLPHFAERVPDGPAQEPPDEPELLEVLREIKKLYEERPIWTRRAIINKVNYAITEATMHLIRLALPYVGYRFQAGPFRDAIIRFGLDPRKDPKYRMYQTIYFQLVEREVKDPGAQWIGMRKSTNSPKKIKRSTDKLSHFFDGRNVAIDGKIWQMCDVSDPLLAKMIREAPIAEIFDAKNDGWFCNGSLAKIRAVMKVKIIALQTGRVVQDEDFQKALEMPDVIPDREGRQVWIPVPDIRLSKGEMERLRASGKDFTIMSGMVKERKAYVGRLRHRRLSMDDEPPTRKRPWDWQHNQLNVMAKRIKTGRSAGDSVGERPGSAESIDPQLLSDQVSGSGNGEDGDTGLGNSGGDSEELEDTQPDRDRVGELEILSPTPENEDRAEGESEDAESIDLVEYSDLPSQLAPSIEGAEQP
jgi:general transcription factor 3C polypeptide 5 (transcription factor C subunit 1)